MNFIEHIHDKYIFQRRVQVLAAAIAPHLPHHATVLDVGCGDGLVSSTIAGERPDISIQGIDVLVRNHTHIPVQAFDGKNIPHDDSSLDAVIFVDVLHHTDTPDILLKEALRVARKVIIIKDHLLEGFFALPTLTLMDDVGNARHGVRLPHNYRPRKAWLESFAELNLSLEQWEEQLGLYPWPIRLIFDRSLHFICRLACNKGQV